ncbi:TetR family transcriptional regulator C-terminal domain-containing protein [Ammonicoccus fulvus]|uniref:TetR family transcriptional regulator C-terminal domain-containing protein n=1 Tax=Ammonicoccus fulvus TaxID=3138240 RepID=A0ABZ3FLW4_9ACTN
MPKVVDVEQRRAVIVEAVFRLVASGGVEAASLRNVAAEAGLNIGSVRHYFVSHDALLLAATEEMARRVTVRMEAHGSRLAEAFEAGDERRMGDVIFALFAELLPLDEQRRVECGVWMAFTERARVSLDLREAADQMHREVIRLTSNLLLGAGVPDAEDRAAALTIGVDGLTLAGLSWPEDYPPEKQQRLLGLLLRQAFGGATALEGHTP